MKHIKVMICEDHSLFREGIKSHINSKDGIKCVGEAENGAQLLHMLEHASEEKFPDIVLLDINMPVMDGMETIKRLKESYESIKVIVLTMHDQVSMVSKMMSLGANSYVPKTEASDQIVKAIVSVYETDYYFNDLTNRALIETMRNKKFREEYEEQKVTIAEDNKIETIEKIVPSLKNKIVVGVLYGLGGGLILSLIVYLAVKIYDNLSVLSN
jgi:DNA-binding NarL/FixJ family response regulator